MFGHYQIGLFAIGQIADPSPAPVEATWHYPWSEPVRFKVVPKRQIALIASGPFAPVLNPGTQIVDQFESRWHYPWSEPIRLNLKHPLKAQYQAFWFGSNRYLPGLVNVTAVMAATETNNDDAEINIYAYDNTPIPYELFSSATVSITELVLGRPIIEEYVTEDGLDFYVAEDGTTFYIHEAEEREPTFAVSIKEIEP